MSTASFTTTPGLAYQLSLLGNQPLPAAAVVNALFRAHPTYAGGRARTFAVPPHPKAREQPARAWLREAFHVLVGVSAENLDVHEVILALALAEREVGWTLHQGGLLKPLLAEMGQPPQIASRFSDVWEALTGEAYPAPLWPAASTAPRPPRAAAGGAEAGAAAKQVQVGSIAAAPVARAVPMHRDAPAGDDHLGRKPFAECIGERLDQVWAERMRGGPTGPDVDAAYVVHLHGPWGSGKSSVLNFLRAYLQRRDRPAATPGATGTVSELQINQLRRHRWRSRQHVLDDRWVVIDFNAWRNQRLRPPWWRLIDSIYAQALPQLSWGARQLLRVRWRIWRARADLLPVALTAVLLALAASFAFDGFRAVVWGGGRSTGLDAAVKTLGTVLTTVLALFAASRSLAFGNARAAQAYADMRNDPLRPIVELFQRLIGGIGRPVAVFVDDLDRCDRTYVVELLEGIQTMFRSAPIAYVIAADRKWITSSFESCYGDFAASVSEPGRPLGYLFLDKLFQVSVAMPRLNDDFRRDYWNALLELRKTHDPEGVEGLRAEAQVHAGVILGDASTTEELNDRIAAAAAPLGDTPAAVLLRQELRARAARRISSLEGQEADEHRLSRFVSLLEPNPRAMKRLVNAFGIHQATLFLEGRTVDPDILARWTILELRWPLVAEHVAERPEAVAHLAGQVAPAGTPEALRPLFGAPAVADVVAGSAPGAAPLDEAAVRQILGLGARREPITAPAELPAPTKD